jgi:hypothetical protein
MAMDHGVWAHYFRMMSAARLETQLIPCLSTMLRLMVSPNAAWLQWLPAGLGCIWALVYFLRHPNWDWMEHGALLILVSVVVAPYSWFMDQVVVLPALLHAVYRNTSRSLIAILAMLSASIELANIRGVRPGNPFLYPWTACVWLLWYLCAVRRNNLGEKCGAASVPDGVTTVPEEA